MRQSGAADGLKDNGVGAVGFLGLDGFEELGALGDGVIVRVNHPELDAEFASRFFGGLCLLDLIIVVVGREGNEKAQFLHYWFVTRPFFRI